MRRIVFVIICLLAPAAYAQEPTPKTPVDMQALNQAMGEKLIADLQGDLQLRQQIAELKMQLVRVQKQLEALQTHKPAPQAPAQK